MSEEKVQEKKMTPEEKKNDEDEQKKNEERDEKEIENVKIDTKKGVKKDEANTEQQKQEFEEYKRREKKRIEDEVHTIRSIMSDHSHSKKALQERISHYIVGVIHEGMDRISLNTNLRRKYSICTHHIFGDWVPIKSALITMFLHYNEEELEEEDDDDE